MKERNIDERDGKFRVRMKVAGKDVSKRFSTLASAVEFRDGLSAEVRDGTMVAIEGQSLLDMRGAFFEQRSGRSRNTERDRYDLHLAKAPFAAQPMSTVTRVEANRWVQSLRRKLTQKVRGEQDVLSWQTRKHILNLARAVWAYAADEGIVESNPFVEIKLEKRSLVVDEETLYLTVAEQQRLVMVDHPEAVIAAFAIGTGLRQGEQWTLHLRDVHLGDEHPHVVVRYGGRDRKLGKLQPPKSDKLRRVPLFGLGLAAARRWLELLPGYAKKNPHGLMFPTERGHFRDQKPPRHGWSLMLAAVGRHIHWHLLRHTCASSLVAGWWGRRWRLEEVKEMLGHSSITVTQRYAHLATSALFEAAEESFAPLSGAVRKTKKAARNDVWDGLLSRWSQVRVLPGAPSEKQGVSSSGEVSGPDNGRTTQLDAESSAFCVVDYPCGGVSS